jgi:homoserine kinase
LRRFDNEAYWKGVEKFSDLAEDIKSHPDRDIIKIVLNATLQKIAELKPDLEASTKLPIKVTVTKCLPAGRVGIGLGSSASSTAIALAIDKLFGDPLRLLEEEEAKRTGTDPLLRLRLMALGEQLVSGSQFFDNVAPLLSGGFVFVSNYEDSLKIEPLNWPRHLHVVTITPDLSLETRRMREIVRDASVSLFENAAETRRRLEVMIGLFTKDSERITRFANGSAIESVRWPLVAGSDVLIKHINQRRQQGFPVSIGISGSGPTIYCLTDSESLAHQTGEELQHLWKVQGIRSWWIVQQYNPQGFDPFHVR